MYFPVHVCETQFVQNTNQFQIKFEYWLSDEISNNSQAFLKDGKFLLQSDYIDTILAKFSFRSNFVRFFLFFLSCNKIITLYICTNKTNYTKSFR